MDTESLRTFCLGLPHTTEDIKWEEHLCFSVGGKMYLITGFEDDSSSAFKIPEEEFDALTERDGIIQAPHFARRKWVSVQQRSKLKPKEWQHYIRQSYDLVVEGLTKKLRKELGLL
ncbi:MmcQ/YjbR family DNA-binding protein [Chitinophagaceae bacterium MMS25-I14]